jgi:hypothetical protein
VKIVRAYDFPPMALHQNRRDNAPHEEEEAVGTAEQDLEREGQHPMDVDHDNIYFEPVSADENRKNPADAVGTVQHLAPEPAPDPGEGIPDPIIPDPTPAVCAFLDLSCPLFEGAPMTAGNLCLRMTKIKTDHNVSEVAMDKLYKLFAKGMPEGNAGPTSHNAAKKNPCSNWLGLCLLPCVCKPLHPLPWRLIQRLYRVSIVS